MRIYKSNEDDDFYVTADQFQVGHASTLDTSAPHPNKKKNPIGFTPQTTSAVKRSAPANAPTTNESKKRTSRVNTKSKRSRRSGQSRGQTKR